MTRQPAHERFEELAAGYALHALEPEEEQAFLAHLASCAACEREVAEHEATLAHLAYASDAGDPPPSLLAGIRAGMSPAGTPVELPVQPATDAPVADLAAVRTRRSARAATWVGAAAALVLVASLAVWNVILREDRAEQAEWGDRMAAAVGQLRDEATEAVPLHGGDGSGEVVAVALVGGDELSLVVDGLPVNEAGTTYVLWGESAFGDKRAVGAFDVTTEGVDVLEGMRLQASVSDVRRLMVTHEHGDVAPPIPTLPVLAVGTV